MNQEARKAYPQFYTDWRNLGYDDIPRPSNLTTPIHPVFKKHPETRSILKRERSIFERGISDSERRKRLNKSEVYGFDGTTEEYDVGVFGALFTLFTMFFDLQLSANPRAEMLTPIFTIDDQASHPFGLELSLQSQQLCLHLLDCLCE